jgi:uncharacterized protein
MLRTELPPPKTLGELSARGPSSAGRGAHAALRDRLAPPHAAVERRRPLFHPARGWLRRTERAIAHFLARDLYPHVPWIERPYGAQLSRGLVLSEATIRLAGLPAAFRGLRVLLVTDVHAGPFLAPQVLARTFERLVSIEPDLILLGGDLVSARYCELQDNAEAFRLLRAPLGVFAVLGNHDHYTGRIEELSAAIMDCGIDVLHNRCLAIERGGERVWLAGVDDALLGRPDLERALTGARPPVILLSHNPDLLFEAARRGVALMLSGHTHAGQIRIPGLPVLYRQSRYRLDEGRYRHQGTELVVSRGLGASALPLRVACSPEAVLLTLE